MPMFALISQFARWPAILFLTMASFVKYLGQVSSRSDQKTIVTPCPSETVVVENNSDASLKLKVKKAGCIEFGYRVTIEIKNVEDKAVSGYEVEHIADYENKKGVTGTYSAKSNKLPMLLLNDSVNVNFNEGFRDGMSYGRPVGHLLRVLFRVSRIYYSDGTEWAPKGPRK